MKSLSKSICETILSRDIQDIVKGVTEELWAKEFKPIHETNFAGNPNKIKISRRGDKLIVDCELGDVIYTPSADPTVLFGVREIVVLNGVILYIEGSLDCQKKLTITTRENQGGVQFGRIDIDTPKLFRNVHIKANSLDIFTAIDPASRIDVQVTSLCYNENSSETLLVNYPKILNIIKVRELDVYMYTNPKVLDILGKLFNFSESPIPYMLAYPDPGKKRKLIQDVSTLPPAIRELIENVKNSSIWLGHSGLHTLVIYSYPINIHISSKKFKQSMIQLNTIGSKKQAGLYIKI